MEWETLVKRARVFGWSRDWESNIIYKNIQNKEESWKVIKKSNCCCSLSLDHPFKFETTMTIKEAMDWISRNFNVTY